MNYVKRPKEEKVVLRMQQLYLKTERKLINEITRKRALGQVDYAEVAALERVQKILTEMQNEAFEYVPQMVETIFHGEGEKNAAGYENARALTTAQTDVSQMLINNLLGEIVEASETALESAKTWLSIGRLEADEFRNAALQFTAEQQAAGASWLTAQKNMAVDLQARGITAFVDKAGRQWSLSDYCAMATRTTARQASVAANLTRDDHDLWQISKIGSTCPVCAVYEGRVYSKSGTNPDYPPLAAAFGKIDPAGPDDLTNTYLNIHPNCLHSLMKYTTIGKTDEQIQKDKDFSSFEKNPITHDPRTKKQIKAYREKENNRRRYIDDYKQWRKYKAAFGDDIPDFDRFRAHKLKDDDKYKEWLHNFRSFRAKAATPAINEDIQEETEHNVSKVKGVFERLFGFKKKASPIKETRVDIHGQGGIIERTKRKQLDTGYVGKIPDDELDSFNKKALEQIIKDTGYSNEEAQKFHDALLNYFGGDYESILNGDNDIAKTIKDGIEKMPVYDGTIYRGMIFDDKDIAKFSQLKPGDEIPSKGIISSWTSDERTAQAFMGANSYERNSVILECVDNKSGAGVQHISKFGDREAEVLSSGKYEVIDVDIESKYDYLSEHQDLLFFPDDLEEEADVMKKEIVCRIKVKEKN